MEFSASVISWRRVWRDQEYSCSGVTLSCDPSHAGRRRHWKMKQKLHLAGAVLEGSAGIWTRDLAHPKRESYP